MKATVLLWYCRNMNGDKKTYLQAVSLPSNAEKMVATLCFSVGDKVVCVVSKDEEWHYKCFGLNQHVTSACNDSVDGTESTLQGAIDAAIKLLEV